VPVSWFHGTELTPQVALLFLVSVFFFAGTLLPTPDRSQNGGSAHHPDIQAPYGELGSHVNQVTSHFFASMPSGCCRRLTVRQIVFSILAGQRAAWLWTGAGAARDERARRDRQSWKERLDE